MNDRFRLILLVLVFHLSASVVAMGDAPAQTPLHRYLIGYREYRTNVPGGRHPNWATMRAYVVRGDGTGRRELAHDLVRNADTWTAFGGWSPDGRTAIIENGWEDPANAAWEEENHALRMTQGWVYDCYLLDMANGRKINVSEPERMSDYNGRLSYWPGKPSKLLGNALIGGANHPVSMNLDGTNKRDLTNSSTAFTYGASVSPDGTTIAYHSDYHLFVAKADGSNPHRIDTGNSFDFGPSWSPDGQWLLFTSGTCSKNAEPYVVRPDGTGLRKLASRNGYKGSVPIIDVFDFHGGSSDTPVWAPDGKSLYYTVSVNDSIELVKMYVDGSLQQLTDHHVPWTYTYHPTPSPDGKWVLYGSNHTGIRQLYVMSANGGEAVAITAMDLGWGAMFAHWNPVLLPEP